MIYDYNDKNLAVAVTVKGTDSNYTFIPKLPSGSTFVWSEYVVTCEGRDSPLQFDPDYMFPVSLGDIEGELALVVTFPKETITNDIRESKIHWRVLIQGISDHLTTQILRGELQLI